MSPKTMVLFLKILCYITMKSTWNMISFPKYRLEPFQNELGLDI